jgi:ABC-type branched-subunit amino acid transport system substrate-binding protein
MKAYEARYPGESSAQQIYVAWAYDALMVASRALRACSPQNAECLKAWLFTVRDYRGASGSISFDSAGDIAPTFELFRVKDRAFVPVGAGVGK